jgi:methylmalonyl-CoA mutase N-terminal domain/subunit
MGGAMRAVESGFIQREIQDSAYEFHKDVESGRRTVVGVNKFIDEKTEADKLHKVDPKLEEEQKRSLAELKKKRDGKRVEETLTKLSAAAQMPADSSAKEEQAARENLLPYICQAVESYATVGEISNTLRKAFGKYRPTPTL